MSASTFFRIGDGKIVEIWDNRDALELFAQLGLVPSARPEDVVGR